VPLDYLKDNNIAYVRINELFKCKLKNIILDNYKSLKQYGMQKLQISESALDLQFRVQTYFNFKRLLKICQDFDISNEELYSETIALFSKGSRTSKELILPKKLVIDEFFVEGYALYFAEGDNGANGKTIPRKVRIGNSELPIHKHFMKWLKTYFPNNELYFRITVPYPKTLSKDRIRYILNFLNLEEKQLRIHEYKWKRNTGFFYITCLDNALLIDFILSIENKIKELCRGNTKLAVAYIRGMFIGEGTAYFNKSRYVRIEMRNEKEIKYLHELFLFLGYECKPTLRTNRDNMWSLYIGSKQLKKYYKEIGFGVHEKRQRILERAANKVLKVNQYC